MVELIENAWRRRFTPSGWRAFLKDSAPEQEAQLRRSLKGNRPCGTPDWIAMLEQDRHAHFAFQRAPARRTTTQQAAR